MGTIKNKTAIVGIGTHEFSTNSGLTIWDMACRCVRDAIDDAGLTPEDIDGIVEYSHDDTDQQHIARSMGMGNLTYFGDCRWGTGAACSQIFRASMAVAAGTANNVVFVRAVNDSSKQASITTWGELESWAVLEDDFYNPFGHNTQAGRIAMIIRRYMHEYGIDSDQFGWVTTVLREYGAKNPNSLFYEKPITYDDYLGSEPVVDPLRELDCAPETDGAVALVVTTAERAKRLRQKPAYILAGAQSMGEGVEYMTGYYRPVISGLPEIGNVGKKLFEMAGVSQKDIDMIQLDDSYGPLVPIQLEELGFCDRGKGVSFCKGGDSLRVDGKLPCNTSGGSLGEGQLYGLNHIAEAVRQIRGTSTAQVKDASLGLIASGAGGPASGLILGS
jgi:acetyl-CoA acetyltransferase